MCDRVGVMYAGKMVEQGPAREVFDQPRHPYTVGLLRCLPRRGPARTGRLHTIPGFLPQIGGRCRPACSSTAARWPLTSAAPDPPPLVPVGDGRVSPLPPHRPHRMRSREPVADDVAGPAGRRLRAADAAASDVSKTFKQRDHEVHALVGRRPRALRRRDAGPGGRVGLGQDHAGEGACSASTRPTRAAGDAGRRRRWPARSPSAAPTTSGRCRSCSRTPTRRSTAARPFAAS